MDKFEAVLHYGLTRSDPPSSGTLRDMFFATVLTEDESDGMLAYRLQQAYCEAMEREDEEGEIDLDLLGPKEAEKVYRAAWEKRYLAVTQCEEEMMTISPWN